MGVKEIDESQWADAQRLSNFVTVALKNPKTRRQMLEIEKTLNPDAVIPELDAAAPVLAEVKVLQETLAEIRKQADEDKAERARQRQHDELATKWNSGRKVLRDAGFTDDGITAVEELMEKRGIADHEAGLALFERLNPPQTAIPGVGSKFDLMQPTAKESDDFKGLFEDPFSDSWLNKAVGVTLKDIRGR